jgi:hypothetical protein
VTHGGAAVSSAQTWTVGGRAHNVHSTGQGIEPLQLMINAKGLPTAQFLPAGQSRSDPALHTAKTRELHRFRSPRRLATIVAAIVPTTTAHRARPTVSLPQCSRSVIEANLTRSESSRPAPRLHIRVNRDGRVTLTAGSLWPGSGGSLRRGLTPVRLSKPVRARAPPSSRARAAQGGRLISAECRYLIFAPRLRVVSLTGCMASAGSQCARQQDGIRQGRSGKLSTVRSVDASARTATATWDNRRLPHHRQLPIHFHHFR